MSTAGDALQSLDWACQLQPCCVGLELASGHPSAPRFPLDLSTRCFRVHKPCAQKHLPLPRLRRTCPRRS